MKSAPAIVKDTIRQGHAVKALPRLVADWNMNRYANPVAENIPAEEEEGFDVELFPIESIVEPLRPTKGILKARVGESVISSEYGATRGSMYYVADLDDQYKYWTSPEESDGFGNITKVEPHIIYERNVTVNKIVIKLENTWASPTQFTVQVQSAVGGAWSTVATNPVINNDGTVILYWNGVGWSSNRPSYVDQTRSIRGVKLSVTKLGGGFEKDGSQSFYYDQGGYTKKLTNGLFSYFSLIEISAHLEVDLTDRLINVSDNMSMSEVSQVHPVGTITSNSASVTLYNGDGFLDNSNPSSLLYGLLEPNVEFNLEYIYHIDNSEYSIQEFLMYTEEFTGQKNDTVQVRLSDFAKYLKEVTPNRAMFHNLTAQEIVWRLCDSVGFNGYSVDVDDRVVHTTIPVWWTNGESTAWELFDDLAKATQTAIYFDAYGILQVQTRQAAFDKDRPVDWTLRATPFGQELADIVSFEQEDEFESNYINVSYKTTKWDKEIQGMPVSQKVWEPEDTVVLRANALTRTLELTDQFLWITTEDALLWPFEGTVQIQGELITYKGKEYVYFTGTTGGVRNVATVLTETEKNQLNQKTPVGYRHKNHFTGGLKIVERGAWNSEAKRHSVDIEGYNHRAYVGGSIDETIAGFRHNKQESRAVMATTGRFDSANDFMWARRGNSTDTGFYHLGTKLRFVKEAGRKHQQAGIAFNLNGTAENGYYVEIMPSDRVEGKGGRKHNEVRFYSRNNHTRKGHGPVKGEPYAIIEGQDYEIDVYLNPGGAGQSDFVSIWINGKKVLNATVPSGDKQPFGGRFGMFVRGQTHAEFEYLYAIARAEEEPVDDYSFLDKVYSGYTGSQWDREWVFRWREPGRRKRKRTKRERIRWNQQFFDEFGPIVHEVREFNVNFDPAPVWGSYLYLTNDWQAVATEYRADAFGATFVVANASRKNAVINGEDSLLFAGGEEAVEQMLTVMGRVLVISDSQTVVAKDEEAIRRRGRIETEIDSDWIQSEDMAKEIADWIKEHWSKGAEGASAQIFGNPLIQVGDIVAVEYPDKNVSAATHKYFVVGVNNNFNNGIETSLDLRRVV